MTTITDVHISIRMPEGTGERINADTLRHYQWRLISELISISGGI